MKRADSMQVETALGRKPSIAAPLVWEDVSIKIAAGKSSSDGTRNKTVQWRRQLELAAGISCKAGPKDRDRTQSIGQLACSRTSNAWHGVLTKKRNVSFPNGSLREPCQF
jgi:hypothetical protein